MSNLEFERLQKEGVRLAAEGELRQSLHAFQKALQIRNTSKLVKRIQKLKHYMDEQNMSRSSSNTSNDDEENYSRNQNLVQNIKSDPQPISNLSSQLCSSHQDGDKFKKFNEYKETAISLLHERKFEEALEKFREALKLHDSSTVKKYIEKIKNFTSLPNNQIKEVQKLSGREIDLSNNSQKEEFIKEKRDSYGVSASKVINKLENTMTVTNPALLSPRALDRFKQLYLKSKSLAADSMLNEALACLNEAKSICASEKVLNSIKKIQDVMDVKADNEEDSQMMEVKHGFFLHRDIYKNLYSYQREGVAWMWKLFQKVKGGVLGDDMGLGKTIQVIAFLSGLIDADLVKHVLIILPVSLLPNWEKEFKKWGPGIIVKQLTGSYTMRKKNLESVQRKGHVLLASYNMVLSWSEKLQHYETESFVWDYIILDEGHKIKNPCKTTAAVHSVPAKHRLVLTGTPVQNNLRELWALYDFTHQGTLLGSMKTFKMQYENPITRAREKDSTLGEKRLGSEINTNLRNIISEYFLRRTKQEVLSIQGTVDDLEKGVNRLVLSENTLTSKKDDFILWVYLSETQCQLYRKFLRSEKVKQALVSTLSPLVDLVNLKKICDHPRLMREVWEKDYPVDGMFDEDIRKIPFTTIIESISDEELIEESGKMRMIISLLENLRSEDHRTLVFSQSTRTLDMIQRILMNRNWTVLRVDGSVKVEERERRIQLFQENKSYSVLLLTTQVGGVGYTLTAADRVILYDPSWNPAQDAQAVDRVYRIGQQRDVVVYRLLTCGSVEEKIYRRQIFKDSIIRQTTSSTSTDPFRYFSKQELRELFAFEDPNYSMTQVQLEQLHGHQVQLSPILQAHVSFLETLNVFGVSHHSLMFTKDTEDPEEDDVSQDYINKRVLLAQRLINDEGMVVAEGLQMTGAYAKTYLQPLKRYSSKNSHSPSDSKKKDDTGSFPQLYSSSVDASIPNEEYEVEIMEASTRPCSLSMKKNSNEAFTAIAEKVKSLSINLNQKNHSEPKIVNLDVQPLERKKLAVALEQTEKTDVINRNTFLEPILSSEDVKDSTIAKKELSHLEEEIHSTAQDTELNSDNSFHSDVSKKNISKRMTNTAQNRSALNVGHFLTSGLTHSFAESTQEKSTFASGKEEQNELSEMQKSTEVSYSENTSMVVTSNSSIPYLSQKNTLVDNIGKTQENSPRMTEENCERDNFLEFSRSLPIDSTHHDMEFESPEYFSQSLTNYSLRRSCAKPRLFDDIESSDESALEENESILANSEDDDIIANSEDDDIIANSEDDDIIANSEDDDIIANSEDDDIIANSEDDDIIANSKDFKSQTLPSPYASTSACSVPSSLPCSSLVDSPILMKSPQSPNDATFAITSSSISEGAQSSYSEVDSPIVGAKKVTGSDLNSSESELDSPILHSRMKRGNVLAYSDSE